MTARDSTVVESAAADLRQAASRIEGIQDLPLLLPALERALMKLGAAYRAAGINLLAKVDGVVACHVLAPGGLIPQLPESGRHPDDIPVVERIWNWDGPCYRPDLTRDNPLGEELDFLAHDYREPVRCILDVPFSLGTVAINHNVPDAFADAIPAVQALAEALTDGLAHRFEALHEALLAHGLVLRERLARVMRSLAAARARGADGLGVLRCLARSLVATRSMPGVLVAAVDRDAGYVEAAAWCGQVGTARSWTPMALAPAGTRLPLPPDDPVLLAARHGPVQVDARGTALLPAAAEGAVLCGAVPDAGRIALVLVLTDPGGNQDVLLQQLRVQRSLVQHATAVYLHAQEAEILRRTRSMMAEGERIARLGSWEWNLQTQELHWSAGLHRILGHPSQAPPIPMDTFIEAVHPADRQALAQALRAAMEGGSFAADYRIGRVDTGEERHLHAEGEVAVDARGCPERLIGSVQDITRAKRDEQALREHEAFLQAIFDQSLNGIVVADDEGTYLSANGAAAQILGYPVEQLIGMNVSQLVTQGEPDAKAQYEDYVASGRMSGQFRFVRPDGEARVVHYQAVRVRQDFNLSILADITDQVRAEQEQRRVLNLESLGLLAGGIAHDLNNLLTGVTNSLDLLDLMLREGGEGKPQAVLQQARESAERTAGLSRQLLTFAKGGAPVREAASIEEVVRAAARQSLHGSRTRAELSFAADLPAVDMDTGQIAQVVQNLVINADQAMPGGGALRITAATTTPAQEPGIALMAPVYVKVCVTDPGQGMSDEVCARAFDPYFTTKAEGNGLGLAVCHSIIQRHGGHITVDSRAGRGTTVTFYLPASQRPARPRAEPEPVASSGPARILLMDDEEIVRQAMQQSLEWLGHQVEVVADGEAALQAYAAAMEAQPFDVVIMDVTIPGGLGGEAAVRRLRQLDPEARAIVWTGYTEDPVIQDPRGHGFDAAVRKPVVLRQLIRVIDEVRAGGADPGGVAT